MATGSGAGGEESVRVVSEAKVAGPEQVGQRVDAEDAE